MEVSKWLVSWFISPIYGMYPTFLYRGWTNPFTEYQEDIPEDSR